MRNYYQSKDNTIQAEYNFKLRILCVIVINKDGSGLHFFNIKDHTIPASCFSFKQVIDSNEEKFNKYLKTFQEQVGEFIDAIS